MFLLLTLSKRMLAGLKLFERKKATVEVFFFFLLSCKDIVNFLQETTSASFNGIWSTKKI